jgi:hypothetical protein
MVLGLWGVMVFRFGGCGLFVFLWGFRVSGL